MTDKPQFPIKYISRGDEHESPEEETYEDLKELACNLEWFDSEDPEWGNSSILDAQGRAARLKVVALDVIVFELKN
jgi:Fe-S-cluster formation regulator IscX/YfhJ